MGLIREINQLGPVRCFCCGKRLLSLPVFKINGPSMVLWLHPGCAGNLRKILENDITEFRKPRPKISFL